MSKIWRTWKLRPGHVVSEKGFCAIDALALEHGLGLEQFLLYSALRGVMRKTWGSDRLPSPLKTPLEAAQKVGNATKAITHLYFTLQGRLAGECAKLWDW
ncbi:hypothetical protein NDU88_000407 [Pleurodeles waltl]|uniref:Uncharacterized protein n=1 Tax=Pleurodeles waltl TaxID=8319 RepID=A0AAV7U459_PLEWA|nr:hypothetical protein NDU88_000407 [Pleurodeles waltl]